MTLILQLDSDYLSHDSIRAGYSIESDGSKKKSLYFVREITKEIIREKKFSNQLLNEKQVWRFLNEFYTGRQLARPEQNLHENFAGRLLSC